VRVFENGELRSVERGSNWRRVIFVIGDSISAFTITVNQ
jgi:hypothetical protein